uniref:Hedgehog acyltransferase n=2 Tax=Latimeria chalumnae TaxID=7897 RepID=H3A5E9_LATCH
MQNSGNQKPQKPALRIVRLPRWEIGIYLVLSFGSHLYSFYEVHKISRDYEDDLDSEFELEKGFFIWGFKKDPTDFEWSFWTEWGKRSLLWTLLGHVIISQVTSVVISELRLWFLMAYGMMACLFVLGLKGLVVILLHTLASFTVAQLRRPLLSWLCSLMLLYTLHMSSLEEIQRDWYETENEYYLLLFSLAICSLRYTSFSLEHCWYQSSEKKYKLFLWMLAYLFYYPVFHNGPVISYDEFSKQIQKQQTRVSKMEVYALTLSICRIFLWWWLAESMIHLMYIHAIPSSNTVLDAVESWALGGLALAQVLFFYVKYLVLFGIPNLVVRMDGIEPPRLP